jgi:RNA polymerase sigma factor (sigma-70 family)
MAGICTLKNFFNYFLKKLAKSSINFVLVVNSVCHRLKQSLFVKSGDSLKQDDFDAYKLAKQKAFGCFLKKMLRNTSRDYFRKFNKQRKHEVCLGDCSEAHHKNFHVVDRYFFEDVTFVVNDYFIQISDELLAETLLKLPSFKRNIILLSGALAKTDREIGEILGIPRSTVQYQKTNAVEILREMLGRELGYEE